MNETIDTTRNTSKGQKAIHAAELALSAELIGSTEEAAQAARTAGRLTHGAGYSLADLHSSLPALASHDGLWGLMVDAWYDAAEAKA